MEPINQNDKKNALKNTPDGTRVENPVDRFQIKSDVYLNNEDFECQPRKESIKMASVLMIAEAERLIVAMSRKNEIYLLDAESMELIQSFIDENEQNTPENAIYFTDINRGISLLFLICTDFEVAQNIVAWDISNPRVKKAKYLQRINAYERLYFPIMLSQCQRRDSLGFLFFGLQRNFQYWTFNLKSLSKGFITIPERKKLNIISTKGRPDAMTTFGNEKFLALAPMMKGEIHIFKINSSPFAENHLKRLKRLPNCHEGRILSIRELKNYKNLILSGGNDDFLIVWNIINGQAVQKYKLNNRFFHQYIILEPAVQRAFFHSSQSNNISFNLFFQMLNEKRPFIIVINIEKAQIKEPILVKLDIDLDQSVDAFRFLGIIKSSSNPLSEIYFYYTISIQNEPEIRSLRLVTWA